MLGGVSFSVMGAYLKSLFCPNCHSRYKQLEWLREEATPVTETLAPPPESSASESAG